MADTRPPKGGAPRRQSGKQRAVRVPLDYYKKPDGLGRLRLVLVTLAPIAALTWWYGGHLLRGERADARASHGPVWVGHALWENDCEACHVPFEPIKSDAALAARGSSRLAGSDRKCASCHLGPIHHANQLAEKTESCGGCHRDHRGRDADLNRVPDAQCTICHVDLPIAIQGGPAVGYDRFLNVSRFDVDHPDFAVRATTDGGETRVIGRLSDSGPPVADPSNLKFDHARHLTPGIESDYSYADLDPDARQRYGWTEGTPLSTPIALNCASCHVLDGSDLPDGLARDDATSNHPPGSSGRTMLPVAFEVHCRACHQLTVGLPTDDRPTIEVPHGLQPSEMRRVLDRTFAAEIVDANRALLDAPADLSAMSDDREAAEARLDELTVESLRELFAEVESLRPGRRLEGSTIGAELDAKVRHAEESLYQGPQTCTECHSYIKKDEADPSTWQVRAPNVPEVWFPHARFAHAAHRAVDCNQCHGAARSSSSSDDILMAPIEMCQACHAPPRYSEGRFARGGARFDCVECHRYHNGDRPLQGIGALARQVDEEDRRTVEEFLRGSPSRSGSASSPLAD